MFKLGLSDRYYYPVTVRIPVDGKKPHEFTFDAEFRRLSQDEIQALLQEVQSGAIDDAALARRVWIGWRPGHVVDEGGAALEYSESARERLMSVFPTQSAIIEAWSDAIRGGREKNSR
ncbi:MAG: hypothetical protein HYU77_13880 [Betaproteobacteria bacterium]|nr:hypothetical protein [Betaproteobacteria bacterium]